MDLSWALEPTYFSFSTNSKDCFNRASFAMTYRFLIKKETTSVKVIAGYEAISSMDILN
jgi:hypothetical protein